MSYDNIDHRYRRNKFLEPAQFLEASNIWTPTVDQNYMLGCIYETNDGRKWRYSKDDGTGIAKNLLCLSQIPDAQTLDILQSGYTVDVGEKRFDLLITTANGLSNGDLADGWLHINQGTSVTDEGDLYKIKNNKWTTSDTVINIEISDQGGVRNAISATSNISFHLNPCRNVHVSPVTTIDGLPIGITPAIVTASYYFWAQYRGPCSVLLDTTDNPAIGEPLSFPGTADVAGTLGVPGGDDTDATLGILMFDQSADDYAMVNLMIP